MLHTMIKTVQGPEDELPRVDVERSSPLLKTLIEQDGKTIEEFNTMKNQAEYVLELLGMSNPAPKPAACPRQSLATILGCTVDEVEQKISGGTTLGRQLLVCDAEGTEENWVEAPHIHHGPVAGMTQNSTVWYRDGFTLDVCENDTIRLTVFTYWSGLTWVERLVMIDTSSWQVTQSMINAFGHGLVPGDASSLDTFAERMDEERQDYGPYEVKPLTSDVTYHFQMDGDQRPMVVGSNGSKWSYSHRAIC